MSTTAKALEVVSLSDKIDYFLEKQQNLTFNYVFYATDGQLLQVIQDMYGAGTDTSTNTVMWYVSHSN